MRKLLDLVIWLPTPERYIFVSARLAGPTRSRLAKATREIKATLAHKDQKATQEIQGLPGQRGPKEIPVTRVRRELLEQRGRRDQPAQPVRKVIPAIPAHKDRKVMRDRKGQRAILEMLVHREQPDLRERQALQGKEFPLAG